MNTIFVIAALVLCIGAAVLLRAGAGRDFETARARHTGHTGRPGRHGTVQN